MKRHTEKNTIRYYRVKLESTLFGDFIVRREYGNIKNKSPTGTKRDLFASFDEANLLFKALVQKKRKKGYKDGKFH